MAVHPVDDTGRPHGYRGLHIDLLRVGELDGGGGGERQVPDGTRVSYGQRLSPALVQKSGKRV